MYAFASPLWNKDQKFISLGAVLQTWKLYTRAVALPIFCASTASCLTMVLAVHAEKRGIVNVETRKKGTKS